MSREQIFTGFILKKTAFNEGDEIITVFSDQRGKVRLLAKSVKLAKSKLQNNLQSLFLCELRTAVMRSTSLGRIIGSQVVNSFLHLRQNLTAVKCAYAAAELVIKFLPDEQPNIAVFKLVKIFLGFLDNSTLSGEVAEVGLLAFKIKFLKLIGLEIKYPQGELLAADYSFEANTGGFVKGLGRGVSVSKEVIKTYEFLLKASFKDLPQVPQEPLLRALIDQFLEYQLERELKAEKSFGGVV